MEKGFYTGDRRQNYCVKCEIDYGTLKKDEKEPKCDRCGNKLRTKFAGLALSGGGFRAALFHLGGLWRLNELGWLKRIAEITSVSGGSITAAYLGLHWKNLTFDSNGVATNFTDEIVPPLRDFCSRTIDIGSIVGGLISPFHRPIDLVAGHYKRRLYGNKFLQDLPADNEGPRFTIYATNLQTGASVRFSQPYLADYRLGKIETPHIHLTIAVAASSAFPPIMCPLVLKLNPGKWQDWPDEEVEKDDDIKIKLEDKRKLRSCMLLGDGGIYDNLGLERVWDRYATVLVSDAGAPSSMMKESCGVKISQLLRLKRTFDIVLEQARALRKRWLIADLENNFARGTYWGIATHIRHYELEKHGHAPPLLVDDDKINSIRSLSRMRTRLNCFKADEQERLINWGYALADAAMRRHVLETGARAGSLPYPKRLM
jgi:NTE family protein